MGRAGVPWPERLACRGVRLLDTGRKAVVLKNRHLPCLIPRAETDGLQGETDCGNAHEI